MLQSFEEVQAALAEFKSKYSLSKVGAQGFCWGGKYTVLALGRVSQHAYAYQCCVASYPRLCFSQGAELHSAVKNGHPLLYTVPASWWWPNVLVHSGRAVSLWYFKVAQVPEILMLAWWCMARC